MLISEEKLNIVSIYLVFLLYAMCPKIHSDKANFMFFPCIDFLQKEKRKKKLDGIIISFVYMHNVVRFSIIFRSWYSSLLICAFFSCCLQKYTFYNIVYESRKNTRVSEWVKRGMEIRKKDTTHWACHTHKYKRGARESPYFLLSCDENHTRESHTVNTFVYFVCAKNVYRCIQTFLFFLVHAPLTYSDLSLSLVYFFSWVKPHGGEKKKEGETKSPFSSSFFSFLSRVSWKKAVWNKK